MRARWMNGFNAIISGGLSRRVNGCMAAVLAMLAVLLTACGDDAQEQYSTEYPCRFTFNTQLHPTSLITLALDNPGSYTRVDAVRKGSMTSLNVSSNNGRDTETVPLTTAEENYLVGNMGANNSIITGCSTFNGLKAYDSQCPNCLNDRSGTAFPLAWTANGQAVKCATCGRTYELNYDGRADNGRPLLQYKIGRNATTLSVYN